MVHSNCLRWSLSDTITNLRTDCRTRTTPIVIYGPERDRRRTETIRGAHPGVWFTPEPLHEITFPDAVQLMSINGPKLTEFERQSMIAFARLLRDAADAELAAAD